MPPPRRRGSIRWVGPRSRARCGSAAHAAPGLERRRALLTDFPQRSLLFWDTLRQRGNTWLDHEAAGKRPSWPSRGRSWADGRTFARPVNYALVRITPPPGTRLDADKRPFVIIDPRAGHGPGIGGFKAESEVGVALKAGHPVYMVVFFPIP